MVTGYLLNPREEEVTESRTTGHAATKVANSPHYCLFKPSPLEPGPTSRPGRNGLLAPGVKDDSKTARPQFLTRDLPFDIGQLSWTGVADSNGWCGYALITIHIKQIPDTGSCGQSEQKNHGWNRPQAQPFLQT